MNNGWKQIKFKASPELYEKLDKLKGQRKWWEFFRDEYAVKETQAYVERLRNKGNE